MSLFTPNYYVIIVLNSISFNYIINQLATFENLFFFLDFKCGFIVYTFFILQTQQNKFVNWQGDAEMRGEDFTATVTLGNPDVLVGSGRSSFVPDTL